MSGFYERVYEAVRSIPRGRVATYGQLALMCGNPRAARAVGQALHHNPEPGEHTPCHRVVNREGRLATGFAFGGPDAQRQLLEAEGVRVGEDDLVDMTIYGWRGYEDAEDTKMRRCDSFLKERTKEL